MVALHTDSSLVDSHLETVAPTIPQLAKAVAYSQNSKLTHDWRRFPVSTSTAAMESCPDTCELKANGCYAKQAYMRIWWERLGHLNDPLAIAQAEAAAIRTLPTDTPLRLHEWGDAKTDEAAQTIAQACDERIGDAWGYTHAGRDVLRVSWGERVSMLASCDTEDDVRVNTARGYACAAVFSADEPLPATFGGLRVFPCPQQTGAKKSCVDCGLCMHKKNTDRMVGKVLLAFIAHGGQAKKLGAHLSDVRS